jgi:hypothetical protein
MDKKAEVPSGIAHLAFISGAADHSRKEFIASLGELRPIADIVGMCLNVLYQGATCHRQCLGGSHLLERLCGRAYNHACGAYQLASFGFYDEALVLVRGLGEITNLIALTCIDTNERNEWIGADRKHRLKHFKPSDVRKRLKNSSQRHLCIDDKWYAELSEKYTHITPDTQPNLHGGKAWIGARYEETGAKEVVISLMRILTHLCVFAGPYMHLVDLSKEIGERLRKYVTQGI